MLQVLTRQVQIFEEDSIVPQVAPEEEDGSEAATMIYPEKTKPKKNRTKPPAVRSEFPETWLWFDEVVRWERARNCRKLFIPVTKTWPSDANS